MIERPDEQLWLERMHNFLQWKVIAPKPENPFGPSISDAALKELAEDKDVLRKRIGLRCLLDGDEVLAIKNLISFSYETTHPNLTNLKKKDCHRYLVEYGVIGIIEKELDSIQAYYNELVKRRKREKKLGF